MRPPRAWLCEDKRGGENVRILRLALVRLEPLRREAGEYRLRVAHRPIAAGDRLLDPDWRIVLPHTTHQSNVLFEGGPVSQSRVELRRGLAAEAKEQRAAGSVVKPMHRENFARELPLQRRGDDKLATCANSALAPVGAHARGLADYHKAFTILQYRDPWPLDLFMVMRVRIERQRTSENKQKCVHGN